MSRREFNAGPDAGPPSPLPPPKPPRKGNGWWWKIPVLMTPVLITMWIVQKRIEKEFPNLTWTNVPQVDLWGSISSSPKQGGSENPLEGLWDKFQQQTAGDKILTLSELSAKYHGAVYTIEVQDDAGHRIGSGTGFAVSEDGYLITNYHVAGEGKRLMALQDGRRIPVQKIVAYHEGNDLALLQIKEKTPNYVVLAESAENTAIGTPVAVIGGPLGLAGTLSDGIVASVRSLDEYGVRGRFIQITAPISPGSSGSPVFLMDGRVIGVATANLYGGQQLNFAVPSNKVVELVKRQTKERKPSEMVLSEEPLTGSDPIFKDVGFRKARLLWVRGNYGTAREQFEPLVAKYPQSASLLSHLADCLARNGEYGRALEYFKTASKLSPRDVFLWERYGVALEQAGYQPQAIQAFEYLLTLDDEDHSEVAARLGKLHANLGNGPKAIAAYERAMKGQGAIRDWAMELSRLHIAQQQWARAYTVLEPFVESGVSQPSGKDLGLLHLARRCLAEQGLSTSSIDYKIQVANVGKAITSIRSSQPDSFPVPRPRSRPSSEVVTNETSALYKTWSDGSLTVRFSTSGKVYITAGARYLEGDFKLTTESGGTIKYKEFNYRAPFAVYGENVLEITVPNNSGEFRRYRLQR